MEGQPWRRILFVVGVFSLLGWPLWSMTRERQFAAPTAAPSVEVVQPLRVEVSFASPPTSLVLEYLGKEIGKAAAPGREFSCDWSVAVPKEGVDLLVKAEWPPGAPKTAVRVVVLRNGTPLVDETFWTEGGLVETVTVPDA